jgi:hypothetical protein
MPAQRMVLPGQSNCWGMLAGLLAGSLGLDLHLPTVGLFHHSCYHTTQSHTVLTAGVLTAAACGRHEWRTLPEAV